MKVFPIERARYDVPCVHRRKAAPNIYATSQAAGLDKHRRLTRLGMLFLLDLPPATFKHVRQRGRECVCEREREIQRERNKQSNGKFTQIRLQIIGVPITY